MDRPRLHEHTFPRSLPHKRGRCREAIGMGLAYHCVYLSFYFYIILEIRQYPKYPKVVVRDGVYETWRGDTDFETEIS
jgi:hypothetical protein